MNKNYIKVNIFDTNCLENKTPNTGSIYYEMSLHIVSILQMSRYNKKEINLKEEIYKESSSILVQF